jgi:enoyl-CoA hydratase/carnithine racemase
MGKYTLWEIQGGVGILTLNRPEKHNALNDALIKEVADLIDACAKDESVKVLLLRGAGKSFCAGGDLKESRFLSAPTDSEKEKCLRVLHRIPLGLRMLPQPVIAELKGMVGGAGLDLAMGCDIRIASDDSRFGSLFTRVGLMPDGGGTFQLPRLVGISKALEMMFTGDLITAQEAYRIGLINQVVPTDKLNEAVMSFAGRLARGPSQSLRVTKQITYRNLQLDLATALDQEIYGQIFLYGTEDGKEGVRVFSEGRQPEFKGS